MKLLQRIIAHTPIKWKKARLTVISICGALGVVILAIPSWWINEEIKNFLYAIIGFIGTAMTWFADTRVEKEPEEV